jgi:hypothetical protein
MDVSSINQQLRGEYQVYLDQTYNQPYWEGKAVSAPLLMHVFEDYAQMEKKILFVGQETHGWGWMKNRSSVDDLQKKYADFALGKSADYGDGKKPRYLRSPFWNFCRSFFYQVNQTVPDITRKTNGFLWTNISKFDNNATTPDFDLQQLNVTGFELLKQEIAIVQPDIVVFLTGDKYVHWLHKLFKLEYVPILPNSLLARLHDQNQSLPLWIFHTQHPHTLCRTGVYRQVLDAMIQMTARPLIY